MKQRIIIGSLATLFVLQIVFASLFGWYFYNFRVAVEQEKAILETELQEEKEKPPEIVIEEVEIVKEVVREVPVIKEVFAKGNNPEYCRRYADSFRLATSNSDSDANRLEGSAQAIELKCLMGK